MRTAAKQAGPGSSGACATKGARPAIRTVGNPKRVNGALGKSQDMEHRSQRTDITPGDTMDRAAGWYGKKAPPGDTILGRMRRFFS